jgi:hypothetical protein
MVFLALCGLTLVAASDCDELIPPAALNLTPHTGDHVGDSFGDRLARG